MGDIELEDDDRVWSPDHDCKFCQLVLQSLDQSAPPRLDGQASGSIGPDLRLEHHVFGVVGRPSIKNSRNFWTVYRVLVGRHSDVRLDTSLQVVADDPTVVKTPYGLLFGRSFKPLVDFCLVKRWLAICRKEHTSACSPVTPSGDRTKQFQFRLVDVQKCCVVDAQWSYRYIALSYVLGGVKNLENNKKNHARLTRAGGLAESHVDVSRTIKDAMAVCRAIDERYLWVDALCIETEDRAIQIANMDIIYQSASLTIVGAAGRNADSGLPGLLDQSRQSPVMDTINGLTIGRATIDYNASLLASTWETRGWTLQEKALSRRLLIFTEDQVYFRCQTSRWQEDTILEHWDSQIEIETQDVQRRHNVDGVGSYKNLDLLLRTSDPHVQKDEQTRREAWKIIADGRDSKLKLFNDGQGSYHGDGQLQKRQITDLARFAMLAMSYTSRSLTYQSDVLEAFTGLLRSFGTQMDTMPNSFIWGVPTAAFDWALSWEPLWSQQGARAPERRREFPSWSWVGWKCAITFADLPDQSLSLDERRPDADICWYGCADDVEIMTGIVRQCGERDMRRPHWRPEGAPTVPLALHNIADEHRFNPNILRFWTSRTSLPIEFIPGRTGVYRHSLSIPKERYARSPKETFAIVLDCAWRAKQPEKLDFIVIGAGWVEKTRGRERMDASGETFVRLMCVEQHCQLAYRVGQSTGPLPERVWMDFHPEWTFVMLG